VQVSKPLNIKDPEVYRLAREVADLTGETLTDSVRHALRDRLDRERRRRLDPLLIEKLMEISSRCAALPVLDPRSDDELIGYDEFGIPS
jgi:antitoxin VapB